MKKLLIALAMTVALVGPAGAAHTNIASKPVPKTVFVLWALEANTKTFEWTPTEAYETLQWCLDKKKELENTPDGNMDVKGFPRPLKCVRYQRSGK